MALSNFIDRVSANPITASWLNKIDALYVTVFGEATTKAAARTALTSDAPFSIAQGGTNSITAPAARTALGSSTIGDALFVATSESAAQTAIGVSALIKTLLDDADQETATNTLAALPQITTVATLRELNWSNDRRVYGIIHTAGHGVFQRVTGAAPGTYVHDGGVVLVSATGDGSAAWIREFSGPVSPRWFGAVPDGVTNYYTKLLAALNYCSANRKAFILDGIYASNSAIAITSTYAFSILGNGRSVSAIIFTNAASAGLSLMAADSQDSGPWIVGGDGGLGLWASVPGANGPALTVGYTTANAQESDGPRINVGIQYTPDTSTANYWDVGLELVNAGSATLDAPIVYGKAGVPAGTGILLTGACNPGPLIIAPKMYNWNKAITKGTTASDTAEGTKIVAPILVANNYGLSMDFSADGGGPGVQVLGGHISSYLGNIHGIQMNQAHILDVLFYRRSDGVGAFEDIYLQDSTSVVISGNIAVVNGTSGTETMIKLVNVDNCTLDGNVTGSSRAVGLSLDANCSNIRIGDTNYFDDCATSISNAITNHTLYRHNTSGTYTPGLANNTNIAASTAYPAGYFRVGNMAHVRGEVDIDPTAAGPIQLNIDLPIPSNLVDSYDLSGVAATSAVAESGRLDAVVATDKAALKATVTDVANQRWSYNFSYPIK